jgi:hypothetical protein
LAPVEIFALNVSALAEYKYLNAQTNCGKVAPLDFSPSTLVIQPHGGVCVEAQPTAIA